jgi:putative redox protein
MDVTINWKGRMSFEGTGNSGFTQKMDSGRAVGGDNSAARPMEFIALGLAGCTAMDVISILQKKKQPVLDFKVQIHAEQADEHPKVFTEAVIEYLVTGRDVDETALLRAIELSAEKYCPAQAMLSKAFPIRMIYKILDDEGMTVREGEYFSKNISV